MTQKHFLNGYVLSGLTLASAFLFPSYFFIGSLFFCIPLFARIIQKNDLTWYHGFLWGIIFFSLHWLVLIPLLYSKAQGMYRMFFYPLFVFYASCWTSIWFFFMSIFARQKKAYASIFITWIYFYLWEHYGFFFMNREIGYCLGSPLLPLNSIFGWRLLVHFFNINILLFGVILGQYFLSWWYVKKRHGTPLLWFIFFIGILFFLSHFFQPFVQNVDSSKTYNHIVHITPLSKNSTDYWHDAQQLSNKFAQVIQKHTECTLLIMPESSFPFPLNRHVDVIQLWTERALGENIGLIIGAHRQEGGQLFNSLYYIKNDHIMYIYDKKKLVPYVEYVPSLNSSKIMHTLFLDNSCIFSPARANRDDSFTLDNWSIAPQICFDFFCHFPEKEKNNNCFMVILNESWFSFTYIQHLMFLYACFISSYLQVTIFYIAYHNAYVINPLFYVRLCSQ